MATFLTRRFGLAGGLAWLGVLTFGVVSEQVKTRLETEEERAGAKDLGAREAAQEVALPGGVRARDLKRGGGGPPQDGYLAVLHFRVYGRVGPAGGGGGGAGAEGPVQGPALGPVEGPALGPVEGPALGPAKGPGPAGPAPATGPDWDDDWGEPLHDTRAGPGKPLVFLFGSRPFKQGVCPGVEAALRGMRAGGGEREVLVPAAQGFGSRGFASDEWAAPPGADLKYVLTLERVSIPP